MNQRIAIVGGGPSGMFVFKRLIESGRADIDITIFESTDRLGEGFPYSIDGANPEHITNVSGNEIPELVMPVNEWIKTVPLSVLKRFDIDPYNFNDYKVLPRLLFGKYLAAQFKLLQQLAKNAGLSTTINFNAAVTDIIDDTERSVVTVCVNDLTFFEFDKVIVCTGHTWPIKKENAVPGYFDSPYPPAKLLKLFNHPVAIKGASLTAIDAVRTLARQHGVFEKQENNKLSYRLNKDAAAFKIVMHSLNGLLPAIRFHLEDSHLSKDSLLTQEELTTHMENNDGFLSLDFIFEKDFKEPIREKDPAFYEKIKDMHVEEFVDAMMALREKLDAFDLFKGEYEQAEKSIRRKESIYWKEMLAILSFAMNYPAKHFSAEDMLRLQDGLMPLISIVIAFVPQSSCEELIALHVAGVLQLIAVDKTSKVITVAEGGILYQLKDDNGNDVQTYYKTFIDCTGQRHLSIHEFPFRSLVKSGSVSAASLKFRSAKKAIELLDQGEEKIIKETDDSYYLAVDGLAINDHFQAVDKYGAFNDRLYIMAVPYIGGFNPDYSGLDFCEEASGIIVKRIVKKQTQL